MEIAAAVADIIGRDLPVAVEGYDGSRSGPADAAVTLVIASPDAVRHLAVAPGELGFGRAVVDGSLEIRGDLYAALALRDHLPQHGLDVHSIAKLARLVRSVGLRPLPPLPPEEVHLGGRRHTRRRDKAAVSYHYDVSPAFYRMILGPSLTYSCAVFDRPDGLLEAAQERKHELVATKLGLRPGQRLLDVGCGWGSMLLHAASHHGVQGVGVTLSEAQAEVARKRVADAGLSDRIEIRVLDYRDVDDGPYDAISSIGMFEHVGAARLAEYFGRLSDLLVPGGRLLNHGISQQPSAAVPVVRRTLEAAAGAATRARPVTGGFIQHYVFPDGELHEVGSVVSRVQDAGLEVRHVESLREHYAITLRRWVANLEANWDDAVAEVGVNRARVWRLYMAGSAVSFEVGRYSVHQVLAVRPDGTASGMPLRPDWQG